MRKIFFLNSCVEWGGGEKWTFETAQELDKRGYKVIIGSVRESELFQRAKTAGLKTKVVPIKNSLSVLNPVKLFSFVNYLREENIEVLFMNLSQDLKFGGIAGKIAGVENIIYRRGSAIPIKDRFYTRFLLGKCITDIIANSQATRETILRNTSEWLDKERINIIYNGIKTEKIMKSTNNIEDIREEFNIDKKTPLMACIGRLSKQKGHKYLIQALKLLKEKASDFKVLIVGKGELEEEIKEYTAVEGLEDYIIFTGFRSDIYQIMTQIDFLVHTALWEGFGFVIAEAMAAGKAVVSTRVSNIAEIVEDGRTGYLAESQNPENIAEKIQKMINQPESSRDKMGQLGREIVKDKFDFYNKVSRLEELYLR